MDKYVKELIIRLPEDGENGTNNIILLNFIVSLLVKTTHLLNTIKSYKYWIY